MKEYICQLCEKSFAHRGSYWAHVNRKTLCVPKEHVLDELQQQKGMTKHYEYKTKEIEDQKKSLLEENERLKKQLELVEELAKEKQQTINFNNFDFSKTNLTNLTIQSLQHNETDFDKYFNVKLTPDNEHTLDHIPPELFLEILKCKTVDQSVTQIVKSIYFNPKAPENYTWTVVDIKAKTGTLRFSHDLNTVVIADTNDTIERNVQSVIPKVMDIITNIQKKVPFSRKQEQNYHGLYGLYGTPLESSTLNEIKNMAYEDRDLPRALWKQMSLDIVRSIQE